MPFGNDYDVSRVEGFGVVKGQHAFCFKYAMNRRACIQDFVAVKIVAHIQSLDPPE